MTNKTLNKPKKPKRHPVPKYLELCPKKSVIIGINLICDGKCVDSCTSKNDPLGDECPYGCCGSEGCTDSGYHVSIQDILAKIPSGSNLEDIYISCEYDLYSIEVPNENYSTEFSAWQERKKQFFLMKYGSDSDMEEKVYQKELKRYKLDLIQYQIDCLKLKKDKINE